MDSSLLLKLMLSFSILIFCFTALFAGGNNINREDFIEKDNDQDENEINDTKDVQIKNGGSVLSAPQRDKDQKDKE